MPITRAGSGASGARLETTDDGGVATRRDAGGRGDEQREGEITELAGANLFLIKNNTAQNTFLFS